MFLNDTVVANIYKLFIIEKLIFDMILISGHRIRSFEGQVNGLKKSLCCLRNEAFCSENHSLYFSYFVIYCIIVRVKIRISL